MIVGTSGLETFLAQLNDLADQYRCGDFNAAWGYRKTSVPVVSIDAPAPAAAGAEDPVVVDPLLMKGLAKRSVRIAVEGPLFQVLDFLRSLEKLEIFVVTDDLSVCQRVLIRRKPCKYVSATLGLMEYRNEV